MTEKLSYPEIKALIKQMSGQDNVISTPRLFIELTGDIITALLLGQIVYWSDHTPDPDGWFYKSDADWKKELALSRFQIKRATEKIRKLGVQTKIDCINRVPKTHYRLDYDVFIPALMHHLQPDTNSHMQESGKCENVTLTNARNLHSQMQVSLIEHEITTLDYYKEGGEEQDIMEGLASLAPPVSFEEEPPPPEEEEKPIPPPTKNPDKLLQALAEVCQIDLKRCTDIQRLQLYQTHKILRAAGDTPEDVRAVRKWWDKHDWRGTKRKEPPKPAELREVWGQAMEWIEKRRAEQRQGNAREVSLSLYRGQAA